MLCCGWLTPTPALTLTLTLALNPGPNPGPTPGPDPDPGANPDPGPSFMNDPAGQRVAREALSEGDDSSGLQVTIRVN